MKMVIATTPSIASVRAAFFDCGWRKALTPFAIDSTPVSALAPEANAFKHEEDRDRTDACGNRMRRDGPRAAADGALRHTRRRRR